MYETIKFCRKIKCSNFTRNNKWLFKGDNGTDSSVQVQFLVNFIKGCIVAVIDFMQQIVIEQYAVCMQDSHYKTSLETKTNPPILYFTAQRQ